MPPPAIPVEPSPWLIEPQDARCVGDLLREEPDRARELEREIQRRVRGPVADREAITKRVFDEVQREELGGRSVMQVVIAAINRVAPRPPRPCEFSSCRPDPWMVQGGHRLVIDAFLAGGADGMEARRGAVAALILAHDRSRSLQGGSARPPDDESDDAQAVAVELTCERGGKWARLDFRPLLDVAHARLWFRRVSRLRKAGRERAALERASRAAELETCDAQVPPGVDPEAVTQARRRVLLVLEHVTRLPEDGHFALMALIVSAIARLSHLEDLLGFVYGSVDAIPPAIVGVASLCKGGRQVTQAELAECLGLNTDQFKQRAHRAKRQLTRELCLRDEVGETTFRKEPVVMDATPQKEAATVDDPEDEATNHGDGNDA